VSLRARLTVVTAAAVAVVVTLASVIVFLLMRSDLRGQADDSLRSRGELIQRRPFVLRAFDDRFFDELPRPSFGAARDYVQLVSASGQTARPPNEQGAVPVGPRTLAVASGRSDAFFQDVSVDGVHARVFTVPLADGVALQVVRPLDDVDRELRRLGFFLLLVSLAGVAVAGAGGALVSRAALTPVRRLTDAAERVARTGDASERVPAAGKDELSRLAGAFNTMLATLEDSIETQRRFVADASHELRTPLTSLQTNIDVLVRRSRLSRQDRERLLGDLLRESQEMRGIVAGLLELARGDDGELERQETHLDELVAACVERARSHFPGLEWHAELEPTVLEGVPQRLERAVWNLLENAGKWSAPNGTVEISLGNGELLVRDHGPGISDEDKPLVFERFYRAAPARAMPGSGLGLSIVRDVAEAHGGTVTAEDAEGGGALLRLRLPGTPSAR